MRVVMTRTEQVGEVKLVERIETVFDNELGVTIEKGDMKLNIDLTPAERGPIAKCRAAAKRHSTRNKS